MDKGVAADDYYVTRLSAEELFKEVDASGSGPVDTIYATNNDSILADISIGTMHSDAPYDVLVFGTAPRPGITTLKLTGTVTTESESTYLPVRVRDFM